MHADAALSPLVVPIPTETRHSCLLCTCFSWSSLQSERRVPMSQSSKGTYAKPDPSDHLLHHVVLSHWWYMIMHIHMTHAKPTPSLFSSTIVYHIYYSHVTLSSPKFRRETYLHRILQHNINLLTLDTLKLHERVSFSLNKTLWRHFKLITQYYWKSRY